MKKLLAVAILVLCVTVVFVLLVLNMDQEHQERVLGIIFGRPEAERWVDDLAADVRGLPAPQELNLWGQKIMDDYQAGTITDTLRPEHWSLGSVVVPSNRIPDWIATRWSEPMFGVSPQVTILADDAGRPKSVIYGWYLKGLVITGTNDFDLGFVPFCVKRAAEGIYAYSLEK